MYFWIDKFSVILNSKMKLIMLSSWADVRIGQNLGKTLDKILVILLLFFARQ